MSLLRPRAATLAGHAEIVGRSLRTGGGQHVRTSEARRQSVVWAAQRLRADLISLMPVDVYRPSAGAGINVPVATPKVLQTPDEVADGHPQSIGEWIYASQVALDSAGNSFGVIRQVDAFGLPARIELVDPDEVTARVKGRKIVTYWINGERHEPRHIWHERQFVAPGLPIGLSPITHAAMQLSGGLSAQQFAIDWFANGAVPSGVLQNGKKTLNDGESRVIKRRFKASVETGDVLVVGNDWTYSPVQAKASESAFLEQMGYSDLAQTRFFGVPADLVDVHVDASATINYANITQRNLQLLVMNLGAAIKRREDALSRVVPGNRFVKLNRDAILAMDPKSRAELFEIQIRSRTRTPDQVRAIEDLQPLAEADYSQFDRLWPPRTPSPSQTPGGN